MNAASLLRGAALLASVCALSLTGCKESAPSSGSSSSTSSSAPSANNSGRTYEIGVIAKSQSNPVFQAARTGAEAAARELGEEMGIDVKINWRTPNAEDAQQQAQYVEQLASQGVDGIAISVTDANLLTDAINAAVAKGVVVVTFDSDAPNSDRMCYYGVDDAAAGRKVMEELAAVMGDEGVVAVLAGNQAAPNLQARVRGVREQANQHREITILDVYYHPETATDAAAKMQSVQTNNPQITGWALVGGWPLYTDNALDGVYENAKVVSMDPLPLPLEYVEKGQVQALVGQPYYGWGYESVRFILDKVHNGEDPPAEINTAPMEVVTSDNVEEYKGRWDEWLQGN